MGGPVGRHLGLGPGAWTQSGWEMGAQRRVSGGKPGPLCGQRENKRLQTAAPAWPSPAARLYSRRACFPEVSGQGVGRGRSETQGNSLNCAFRFLIVK